MLLPYTGCSHKHDDVLLAFSFFLIRDLIQDQLGDGCMWEDEVRLGLQSKSSARASVNSITITPVLKRENHITIEN